MCCQDILFLGYVRPCFFVNIRFRCKNKTLRRDDVCNSFLILYSKNFDYTSMITKVENKYSDTIDQPIYSINLSARFLTPTCFLHRFPAHVKTRVFGIFLVCSWGERTFNSGKTSINPFNWFLLYSIVFQQVLSSIQVSQQVCRSHGSFLIGGYNCNVASVYVVLMVF